MADIAVVSAERHGTLASRVNAWFDSAIAINFCSRRWGKRNADIATLYLRTQRS